MFSWLFPPKSRFGKKTQLRGLLECGDDPLRIDGTFRGVIRSDATVTVGRDGEVQGDIQAHDVIIAGRVEGTVVARGKLRMCKSGVIAGDAYYVSLRVDDGGAIQGSATALRPDDKVMQPPSTHARQALANGALRLPETTYLPEAPPQPDSAAATQARPKKSAATTLVGQKESTTPARPARAVRQPSVRTRPDAPSPLARSGGKTSQWPSLSLDKSERVLSELGDVPPLRPLPEFPAKQRTTRPQGSLETSRHTTQRSMESPLEQQPTPTPPSDITTEGSDITTEGSDATTERSGVSADGSGTRTKVVAADEAADEAVDANDTPDEALVGTR